MTTQSGSKQRVPTSKPNRENFPKTPRKITSKVGEEMLIGYELQRAAGKRSEDILEGQKSKYGKSPRQIQRYLSRARRERAEADRSRSGRVGNLSYINEARRKHNRDICQLIQQWKEQLVTEIPSSLNMPARYEPLFPVSFAQKDSIPYGYRAKGALHWYVGKGGVVRVWFSVEDNPIFPCLKYHLPSKKLWSSFDKLKEALVEGIRQGASTNKATGVFVGDAISLASDIADELTIALAKRIFPGKCKACPEES